MRRLVHLLAIVAVIVSVRACGGLTAVEDRMSASSRWAAERTGMTTVRDRWRDNVSPAIAGRTRAASLRLQQTTTAVLERLASGTGSVRDSIGSAAGRAASAIGGAFTGSSDDGGGDGGARAPAGSNDASARAASEAP
jgi:hypothetical protein